MDEDAWTRENRRQRAGQRSGGKRERAGLRDSEGGGERTRGGARAGRSDSIMTMRFMTSGFNDITLWRLLSGKPERSSRRRSCNDKPSLRFFPAFLPCVFDSMVCVIMNVARMDMSRGGDGSSSGLASLRLVALEVITFLKYKEKI